MYSNKTSYQPDNGSFRDSGNLVFSHNGKIYRGLDENYFKLFNEVSKNNYFINATNNHKIIKSKLVELDLTHELHEILGNKIFIYNHPKIQFLSYPYEWSFEMMKDAALLHLELLLGLLEYNWIIKDSSSFNIQFIGYNPIFIDICSFQKYCEGDFWRGYHQFVSMFFFPLLIKSHLDIDFSYIFRNSIEGINADECRKFFRIIDLGKPGVFSHIFLPYILRTVFKDKHDISSNKNNHIKQKKYILNGNIYSLQNTIKNLKLKSRDSQWLNYKFNLSYSQDDYLKKIEFINQSLSKFHFDLSFDLGCNTGDFSVEVSKFSKYVIAIDSDQNCINDLYIRIRQSKIDNILPLVINLTNPSPSMGWESKERVSFFNRERPNFILCLALLHHLRVVGCIPLKKIINWLASFNATIIIEFVDREDEMFKILASTRDDNYEDYSYTNFEFLINKYFFVNSICELKGGKRKLYFLTPILISANVD